MRLSDTTQPAAEEILARYDRAFAVADGVVAAVPSERWTNASPCPGWTARDVLNHLLWGQVLVHAWATGDAAPSPDAADWTRGVPDSALAVLWSKQRQATREALTEQSLSTVVTSRGFGTLSIGQFTWTFPSDALLHAWDIATANGVPVALPSDLASAFLEWGEQNEYLLRRPGGFGDRQSIPQDANVTEHWLAFAGRSPR